MGTNIKDVFNDALDRLQVDAASVGMTLTSICRATGVSRATPDRWRREPPKTIEILGKMQDIVEAARKEQRNGPAPEEQFRSEL